MKKNNIDFTNYRQDKNYIRNRRIWEMRIMEGYSLKEIAALFHLEIQEIKTILAMQKAFYEHEFE